MKKKTTHSHFTEHRVPLFPCVLNAISLSLAEQGESRICEEHGGVGSEFPQRRETQRSSAPVDEAEANLQQTRVASNIQAVCKGLPQMIISDDFPAAGLINMEHLRCSCSESARLDIHHRHAWEGAGAVTTSTKKRKKIAIEKDLSKSYKCVVFLCHRREKNVLGAVLHSLCWAQNPE